MNAPVLPLHMGVLHPYEQVLVYVLAFGPFLLLGIVIVVRRRQDRREDESADDPGDQRDR
jgi:Na+-translocating ferredoxin:NAD+ oxidoreductase RnfE subunit